MNHTMGQPALPSEATRERMLSDFSALRHRKTRNHRFAGAAVFLILALGTTAGGLAIARAPQAVINNATECYGSANTNSTHFPSVNVGGDPTTQTATPVSQRVTQAIDGCGASWRIGEFESDQTKIPAGKLFTIPTLVACQLADGRVGVFPSGKSATVLCSELELALPQK